MRFAVRFGLRLPTSSSKFRFSIQTTGKARVLAEQYGASAFDSLDALLAHPPLDAVLIGSPSGLHAGHAMAAVRAGKHVLVEKPLDIQTAQPTSIMVTTHGTGKLSDEKLADLVRRHFDLRPKGIIQMLDLLRPIYEKTAAYGHFGRDEPEFSWEKTDKAAALREAAGLKKAA